MPRPDPDGRRDPEEVAAAVFAALAEPTRRSILSSLAALARDWDGKLARLQRSLDAPPPSTAPAPRHGAEVETDEGTASLADLFAGRSQLLIYHFMFGADYSAGCPSCSAIADGFNGSVAHLANHDVAFSAVSRAPLAKLQAYKRRMGWSFPWASSSGSDFSHDFQAAVTKQEWESGAVEYNFRSSDFRPPAGQDSSGLDDFASSIVGTDWATYRREGPGVSAFALEDGAVYHTYSAYARGLDGLWGMYQWLDRAPFGRNENGFWWRRHDEYDSQ